MTLVPIVILACAVALIAVQLVLKHQDKWTAGLFLKVACGVLFIALAAWAATHLAAEEAGLSTLAFFVVMGLVMGMLGDIWLDQKSLHLEKENLYTVAGFSCFGIGHIFYTLGLLITLGKGDVSLLIIPLIAAAVMVAVMLLIEKPLHMDYGAFRIPVALYTFVIVTATVLPIVLCVQMSGSPLSSMVSCFAVGMVLFLLSDLVLSQGFFSTKNVPYKLITPVNLILYYGGQFSIAAGLLFIPLS